MKNNILITSLLIFILACSEQKIPQPKIERKYDTLSEQAKKMIEWNKFALHFESNKTSHFAVLESESKLLDNQSIRDVLNYYNVKFPLNLKFVYVGSSEGDYSSYFNYMYFVDKESFYISMFSFNHILEPTNFEDDWFQKQSHIQKEEIVNNCLNVKDYCVLIVKVLWKPYLEELKSKNYDDLHNIVGQIYDSLLIEWNKQDFLNKQPKR